MKLIVEIPCKCGTLNRYDLEELRKYITINSDILGSHMVCENCKKEWRINYYYDIREVKEVKIKELTHHG